MNEKWARMPVREDVHSRRILRDIVHAIVSSEVVFLATSVGSFPLYQSLRTRGPLGQQSEWILARIIWYCPTDSYQKIFGSFPADVVDILLGIPVWYCGASAICLDLPSVRIFWKDLEDPGGACLSPSYTSNKRFSQLRLLAIIGSPLPMTIPPNILLLWGEIEQQLLIQNLRSLSCLPLQWWLACPCYAFS